MPCPTRHSFQRLRIGWLGVWLVWLWIVGPWSVGAQESYNFQTLQEGLSNSSVRSILKDNRGFLWFGTEDGLNKYDGVQMQVYRKNSADPRSLCHNSINALLQDRHDTLWIGTSNGLMRYHAREDNFSLVAAFAGRDIFRVKCLYVDSLDVLWIGTSGNGLFAYNTHTGAVRNYTHRSGDAASIASNFITAIVPSAKGGLWIGTRDGLDLLAAGSASFMHYLQTGITKGQTIASRIEAICTLGSDAWVGCYGEGLLRISAQERGYLLEPIPNPQAQSYPALHNILSLSVDNAGNIWLGTENGGLCRYTPRNRSFLHILADEGFSNSLSSNSIWSLYHDSDQILWIGTAAKGLCLLDAQYEKFRLVRRRGTAATPVSNNVKGFAEAPDSSIWIITDGGGLSRYYPRQQRFAPSETMPKLPTTATISLILDQRQRLWVGTWAGGLFQLDANGALRRQYNTALGNIGGNNVVSLYEDPHGRIWACTFGNGLYVLNEGEDKFRLLQDTSGRTNLRHTSFVNAILHDHRGEYWVGTQFGLVRIRHMDSPQMTFEQYQYAAHDRQTVSSFRITQLFEDSQQRLWIGTDEGLNLFQRRENNFLRFGLNDGLPNENIKSIAEDQHGALWISTYGGLAKFLPEERRFQHFSRDDGLNSNEFNHQAVLRSSSGELYVGGRDGFNVFRPDQIRFNTQVPPVYITHLQLFRGSTEEAASDAPLRMPLHTQSHIDLPHYQNAFTLHYVALNFTRSSKNRYAYMLQGFDHKWIVADNNRSATYTNLDPGEYTFLVRGSNNDGLWNPQAAKLHIRIAPPLWKTWWAYTLYLLVLVLVAGAFTRLLYLRHQQRQLLRLEKLHHQQEEELARFRTELFTNISHELRTPLTLILNPIEQILKAPDTPQQQLSALQMIRHNALKLYRLVNELMDFTKSENEHLQLFASAGNLVQFCHSLYLMYTDEAARRQIHYHFDAPTEPLMLWFDKNKLEKILLNLLSNAFKFVDAHGSIRLELRLAYFDFSTRQLAPSDASQPHNVALLCVEDNGPGIAPEYLPRVFDRFFQSPASPHQAQSGTGIGLALARSLVLLHHGFIWAESVPSQRTSFSVVLPLGKKHLQAHEIVVAEAESPVFFAPTNPALAPTEAGPKHKNTPVVLVVEDNYDLRQYLVSLLQAHYRVLEAENGEVALQIANEQLPNLILSDIIMPRLSGIELCHELKTQLDTCHIAIILLSAKSTVEEQIEGIHTGADDYIPKPFHAELLLAKVRNLIDTRRKLFQQFSQEAYLLPKEMATNPLDEQFLERVLDYLHANLEEEDITVESLATHLLMNRSNLYRKIKALTGQTATEFIRTIRLKAAIKYLETGQYSIAEVAYKVGFSSPGYFTKCFKAQFGKLPSEMGEMR